MPPICKVYILRTVEDARPYDVISSNVRRGGYQPSADFVRFFGQIISAPTVFTQIQRYSLNTVNEQETVSYFTVTITFFSNRVEISVISTV